MRCWSTNESQDHPATKGNPLTPQSDTILELQFGRRPGPYGWLRQVG